MAKRFFPAMQVKHNQLHYVLMVLAGLFVFIISCNKDEDTPSLPALSTKEITEVTKSSATSGGNITSDGGSDITARGICWNVLPDPSLLDHFTTDGSGIGAYESIITGLDSSTTYYVRAYAANAAGTSYGNEVSFSTHPFIYYSKIAAGSEHSLAIKSDGTLWAWGSNEVGQLGDGTIANRINPVKIGPGYGSMDAAGYSFTLSLPISVGFTLAIKTDGSAWSWGANEFGQLGNGNTIDRKTPVMFSFGFVKIEAGESHALALTSDGTLWAWGNNSAGQLGNGELMDQHEPEMIGPGYSVIAAGGDHSMALKTDGTLWSWGLNVNGQVGDGTIIQKTTPTLIGSDYKSIAAGDVHSLGLKNDGTLWAWGGNTDGQLGDGTTIQKTTPVMIGSGFTLIAAGGEHSLALKTDGSLWAWGNNNAGQIGDGTTSDRNVPVEIGSGYIAIAAGDAHTLALKSDGTLWAWGLNYWGQLGDGTKVDKNRPLLIGPK